MQAEAEQTEAQARPSEARELIHELSDLYHPYALDDGAVQPVERAAARVANLRGSLQRLAVAADLPTRASEQLGTA